MSFRYDLPGVRLEILGLDQATVDKLIEAVRGIVGTNISVAWFPCTRERGDKEKGAPYEVSSKTTR